MYTRKCARFHDKQNYLMKLKLEIQPTAEIGE